MVIVPYTELMLEPLLRVTSAVAIAPGVSVIAILPVTLPPMVMARPAFNDIVPKDELMAAAVIKSPTAVVAVKDTFIPAVIVPLLLVVTARPELNVTCPSVDDTAALMAISEVAPTEVIDTLPNPVKATAPLTVTNPPAVANTKPLAVLLDVLTPPAPTVRLPVPLTE